ncbi:hypothetical protein [Maridesulfovibrio ferrireducens]|uniref:hypothetical protein n=1 Tax=Maridesulfovibrio ferrireducens TaxID=246191 RepID=UPI001A2262D3|nr:hypothetical protein [Maridesulfovibrio ferrireducens]MBI9110022.1 hypothetical protein [Maridesulfovibrio ferrireducens]
MSKPKKKCPLCSANYSGKRCRSQVCSMLRALPTGRVRDWKIWTSIALLSGIVGVAVEKQGEIDQDAKTVDIGKRIHRWAITALEEGKRFGVPLQYAELEDRRFDAQIKQIWASDTKLHILHAADTLKALVSDVKDRFSPEFTSEKMACWNWLECALTALMKDSDSDILEYADQIFADYQAFHAAFWGEKSPKKRQLRMYDIGERFAVAAHSKAEALEIVRMNSGLINLPVKGMVESAKVEFEGRSTTYGCLLELFKAPGLVAVMREGGNV